MRSRAARVITGTVLLLSLASIAAAHGDEHDGETMDMSPHAAPDAQPPSSSGPRSYWSLTEHVSLMYWHIALEVMAWIVILPVAVMLSIARSRWTLPSQIAFLALNAFAIILGFAYNHKTPELYQNNAHGKMGWAISWIASAWGFMTLIQGYVDRSDARRQDIQPMTSANIARYQRVQYDDLPAPSRWSNDSGQGTERNSASLYGHSRSPSVESTDQQTHQFPQSPAYDDFDSLEEHTEKRGFLRDTPVDRFMSRSVARFVVGRTYKIIQLLSVLIERTILAQGFAAIATGTVVYGGIGRGGAVFNVLAHFTKGGIFFLYGFLTLGRWMGAFAEFGWAWNAKPSEEIVGRRKAAVPSAEFTESFVIWLYGVTNVFLEHLAAWGGAWVPQDLEHVSISVMFFGGGLLGMIIESNKVRRLLNSAVTPTNVNMDDNRWQEPRQYRTSMNVLPALIIMLLGKMMSSHHQESMLSSMIHGQWGTMFMGFALARIFSYVLMYLSPPVSYFPSRPPTEILAAFCLISGGITFMLSNKDTVAVLEGYGVDAMFTFTVTMGLTAILMAWATIVLAVKGWATRKESYSFQMKGFTSNPA